MLLQTSQSGSVTVKGLALSERYFLEICLPMIEEQFPAYQEKIAAGLVGDGSECFGFDDEISRDHDWGPAFCLWLTKEDYGTIGPALRNEVDKLPREFAGIKARSESFWGGGRTGVFEIGEFYKRFIGFNHVPEGLREWQVIPEENLAAATNGKVFMDPVGMFTAFRERLKAFYPEDVRLKKIASRCMTMAQSGQYNYTRCIKRKEYVAARLAETRFINDAISMVFLLNKRYKPFYKWMHRAVRELPILGDEVYSLLSDLVADCGEKPGEGIHTRKSDLMEETCRLVIEELKKQRLSDSGSDFLLDHGPVVQAKIKDTRIRDMNVWVE
jgi:hypothetical protein